MASLPPWTQRVIRKLVNQFIPEEFSLILNVDSSVFSEGVAIAFGAQGQTATLLNPDGRRFARLLGQQLNAAPEAQRVAELVVEGGLGQLDEVQKHVLSRIFDPDPQVRSSFVKGLNVGNELPGLLATKIDGRSPAAEIYIVLWLYWPQINAMNSIGEVSRAIAPFFKDRPSLAGSWDERFRKLANRLKLSFRAKQVRRRARRR